MRFVPSFLLLVLAGLAIASVHAGGRRRTTRTSRTVRVEVADTPRVMDDGDWVPARRTARVSPLVADDDDDDDGRRVRAVSNSVPTYLHAGKYKVYFGSITTQNPFQNLLRDMSGRTLYSLRQNSVFSRSFTLYDETTGEGDWTARSGIPPSWSRFTNPRTSKEVSISREHLHWGYKFHFTYKGRNYIWHQDGYSVARRLFRMNLYRVSGDRRIQLMTIHRTIFWHGLHHATIKVTQALVNAIARDPSLEGLVVAMAMRLNREIKWRQTIIGAGVGTAAGLGILAAS